jgi:hypothetical protein
VRIQLKVVLLQGNVYLVQTIFAAALGKTAVFRKIPILPGFRSHQHLSQVTAGELARVAADNIENGLLQRCELAW